MGELQDLHIHGIGTAAGGVYDRMQIHGRGKIHGSVECQTFEMHGVCTVHGDIQAERLEVHGQCSVDGNLSGTDVRMHGRMTVKGDCSAETFRGDGGFTIDGLLNAERIEIRNFGASRVGDMGGQTIVVRREHGMLFGKWKRLTVDAIEGDDIQLEYTHAKVVRGKKVVIGRGCDIDRVEYTTNLQVTKGANVGSQQRV